MKKMIFVVVMMSVYAIAEAFKPYCTCEEVASITGYDANRSLPIGSNIDRAYFIYPKTTYLRERDIIQAWTISAEANNTTNSPKYGFLKVLYLFDIDKNRYAVVSYLEYSCKGRVIDGTEDKSIRGGVKWNNIVPDSVAEGIYQKAMEIVQTEPVNHKEDKQPRYPNFDNLGFGRTLNEP